MIYKILYLIYYQNMLTKDDKNWLKKNFSTKDDLKNFATKDDLKNGLEPINKSLKSIKNTTTKIRKDLEMVTGEFDRDLINLKKRTEKIEKHIGFPPIQSAS